MSRFFPLSDQQKKQVEIDLKAFVTGRRRFYAVVRWVETQEKYQKEPVATYIAQLFRDVYLNPKDEYGDAPSRGRKRARKSCREE